MIFLLWMTMLAVGNQLTWDLKGVDHKALIEVALEVNQDTVFLRYTQDNLQQPSAHHQLADEDPSEGAVQGQLPNIFIGNGEVDLVIRQGDQELERRRLQPTTQPPRVKLISTSYEEHLLVGWNRKGGFALTSIVDGVAALPIDGRDGWEVLPIGSGQATKTPLTDTEMQTLARSHHSAASKRELVSTFDWWVRLFLLPVSLLLVVALFVGLNYARRIPGFWLAAALAAGLSSWISVEGLSNLGDSILMAEDGYNDPPTSVSLLASIADSVLVLSELSTRYNAPEGHSWMILGPNWLAYLLVSPVEWLSNALAAHTIGVLLALILNALFAWLLARKLGCSQLTSMIALVGCALTPVLLNELDKLSLDRSYLFPVTSFVLCWWSARQGQNRRLWLLGAGLSLAAAFYCQVYYGIYLLASLPLLLLWDAPTLLRFGLKNRRETVLWGFGLIALLLPGLLLLTLSTSGTVYDDSTSLRATVSFWNPIDAQAASTYLERFDPRSGGGQMHKDMSSPATRLMSTVSNSLPADQLLFPTKLFFGRSAYWFYLLLGLCFVRRKEFRFAIWVVVIFAVLSLGPMLKWEGGFVGTLLPYYLFHYLVPSFEQLKHPDRFALMAAVIAPIPLAIVCDSLLRNFSRFPRISGTTLCCFVIVLGVLLQPTAREEPRAWWTMELQPKDWGKMMLLSPSQQNQYSIGLLPPQLPRARHYQRWSEVPKGGLAVLLPDSRELPVEHYLGALQADMWLVNDPPHGSDPGKQQQRWIEQNSVLNAAAFLSGSDIRHNLSGAYDPTDLAALERNDVKLVLMKEELPNEKRQIELLRRLSPVLEVSKETEALLVLQPKRQ